MGICDFVANCWILVSFDPRVCLREYNVINCDHKIHKEYTSYVECVIDRDKEDSKSKSKNIVFKCYLRDNN